MLPVKEPWGPVFPAKEPYSARKETCRKETGRHASPKLLVKGRYTPGKETY